MRKLVLSFLFLIASLLLFAQTAAPVVLEMKKEKNPIKCVVLDDQKAIVYSLQQLYCKAGYYYELFLTDTLRKKDNYYMGSRDSMRLEASGVNWTLNKVSGAGKQRVEMRVAEDPSKNLEIIKKGQWWNTFSSTQQDLKYALKWFDLDFYNSFDYWKKLKSQEVALNQFEKHIKTFAKHLYDSTLTAQRNNFERTRIALQEVSSGTYPKFKAHLSQLPVDRYWEMTYFDTVVQAACLKHPAWLIQFMEEETAYQGRIFNGIERNIDARQAFQNYPSESPVKKSFMSRQKKDKRKTILAGSAYCLTSLAFLGIIVLFIFAS